MFDSKKYWQDRYSKHGSGAGSRGDLRVYKQEVINKFLTDYAPESVIELGCGDGVQLSNIKYENYTGYDYQSAVDVCNNRHGDKPHLKFRSLEEFTTSHKAELTISLDVIYHLTEKETYHQHLENLFLSSEQYVIIYSTNFDENPAGHICHRKFTTDVEKYNFENFKILENPFEEQTKAKFYFYKKTK